VWGPWKVEGGAIACKTRAAENGVLMFDPAEFNDFELTADVWTTEPDGIRYGVIFRRRAKRLLAFYLTEAGDRAGAFAGTVLDPGPLRQLDGVTLEPSQTHLEIRQGVRYRIRVVCQGERFRCYVGERLCAEGTDTVLRSGHIGLHVSHAACRFANIRLRRLAPEAEPRGEAPAAGAWQSLFDGKTLRGWRVVEEFPRRERWWWRRGVR